MKSKSKFPYPKNWRKVHNISIGRKASRANPAVLFYVALFVLFLASGT